MDNVDLMESQIKEQSFLEKSSTSFKKPEMSDADLKSEAAPTAMTAQS